MSSSQKRCANSDKLLLSIHFAFVGRLNPVLSYPELHHPPFFIKALTKSPRLSSNLYPPASASLKAGITSLCHNTQLDTYFCSVISVEANSAAVR